MGKRPDLNTFASARACFANLVLALALKSCGIACEPTDTVLYNQSIPRVPVHLVSEASIAGKPRMIILDTGAANAGLDNSLKNSIRAELAEADVLASDGKSYPMMTYEGPPIKIGKLSVKHTTVILSDFNALSLLTGYPVSGVIGMKVLGHVKILLNYDERVFQLHAGAWKLDKSDCHEVALNINIETPTFKTQIIGREIEFTVDTGSDDCITLETKVFDALVKDRCIELADFKGGGLSIGGMSTSATGWFLKGELMGKMLAGVSVNSNPTHSTMGLAWLYGFNTEIDAAANKLRYQLRRNAKFLGGVQVMLGAILLYDSNGARIKSLLPGGGAAEGAGLKPDDIIERFGDLKAGEMNAATVAEAVAEAAGKEVPIRLLRRADGERVSIKLKLPPNISEWNFSGRKNSNGK